MPFNDLKNYRELWEGEEVSIDLSSKSAFTNRSKKQAGNAENDDDKTN